MVRWSYSDVITGWLISNDLLQDNHSEILSGIGWVMETRDFGAKTGIICETEQHKDVVLSWLCGCIMIRYDTIEEINVDSKAEYTA